MTINLQIKENSLNILKAFLDNAQSRFLFGATIYAAEIIDKIHINGVIDDFYKDSFFHGVKVFCTKDVPKNALIVSTTLGRPKTAYKRLMQLNLSHCDYFTFHCFSNIYLPNARFWSGFKDETQTHLKELRWVCDHLEDQISTDTFEKIINFRLTADLSFLDTFNENQSNQYFESFLNLNQIDECFVDVGSFDGYTTDQFIKCCPEYKAIHIFEPDPTNFNFVFNKFRSYPDIHFYQVGLGNLTSTISFLSSKSTSKISDDGDIKIKIMPLDQFLIDCSFLKIDIEGYEYDAIFGAQQTILRCHPRIAIAVYHKPEDLWTIPQLILKIRNDYKIYVRHYTEGVTETIMFFIPK